jgi:hypothetical protein
MASGKFREYALKQATAISSTPLFLFAVLLNSFS